MVYNPRDEPFPFRELDLLPHAPFMFMAGIRRFDRIGLGLDLQDEVDDILEGDIELMGAVIAAPAHVYAYHLFGHIPEGVVLVLPSSPSLILPRPDSHCCCTTSATALRSRLANAASS
jgi:hypothetical protein